MMAKVRSQSYLKTKILSLLIIPIMQNQKNLNQKNLNQNSLYQKKLNLKNFEPKKIESKEFEEGIAERKKTDKTKKSNEKRNTVTEFNKGIVEKDKIIKKKLFKQYFRFQSFIDLQKHLYETKNKNLVHLTEIKPSGFKKETKQISEDEISGSGFESRCCHLKFR